MEINSTLYNKAVAIPYNPKRKNGYQPRPTGRLDLRSIIVHTTNGKKGSTLAAEARYICDSRDISANYLIGKRGEIIQFLDPRFYIAYHAGCVKSTRYSNFYAIGIEMHNTPSEGHITVDMKQSLDWLVRKLLNDFPTIGYEYVETHRNVAVFCPDHILAGRLGRKIDPSGFNDAEFYLWRNTLRAPHTITYRVTNPRGVNIRQSPQVNDSNIAGTLEYNDVFVSDVTKLDENGETINGSNLWAHILQGTSNGKPVDQLGFVHLSNLKQVE